MCSAVGYRKGGDEELLKARCLSMELAVQIVVACMSTSQRRHSALMIGIGEHADERFCCALFYRDIDKHYKL